MSSPFPCSTTFAANNFSRKGIAVLILCIALLDFHVFGALVNHGLRRFKILNTDYRFVMLSNVVLRLLTIIDMPNESLIGKCFLKKHITFVLFISKDRIYCARGPFSFSPGWDSFIIKISSDYMTTFTS